MTVAELLLVADGAGVLASACRALPHETSGAGLEAWAARVFGEGVWLLHDGGLWAGRGCGPLRFERRAGGAVPGGTGPAGAAAPPLPGERSWQRAGWRDGVTAWAQGVLGAPVTRCAWVHASDVGAVVVLDGPAGRAFLKVGEDAREVVAARWVARHFPHGSADLLGTDTARGLLLTRDAGTALLGSADLNDWRRAVRRMADLHTLPLDGGGAEGLPVQAFAALPGRLEGLLREDVLLGWGMTDAQVQRALAARPAVLDAHARVTAACPRAAPCHGDLHANNVLVPPARTPGDARLFDWSEAHVGQPLMDVGWFLAFVMLPFRADLPVRAAYPDLAERLWDGYRDAAGLDTALPWRDVALLSLYARAAAYDARYRAWSGTVPGFRPLYAPYALRTAAHFAPA
ncbi:phosphotransferase [Deinococcus aquiradiocola]|uniref:Aminoglycoside phosphotransferase domain-containing protein n=1 Tax=Deinococcus aquiradiocola TaxID=393059 RepID=A0A917P4B4_9DEIO|nr:phosphotransferase [Deinococcus aquiradiocola]GGJ60801.1 hypothetical protein GCM10008939_00690 [Deinococcus aquiradiocola]